jgi:multidrug efflux pump subunit AcrB
MQASINQAKGGFDGPHQSYQINANDQLLTSKDYKSLVIAYNNGAALVLSDVARVVDDVEKHEACSVDERDAGHYRKHSAAAGREYHSGG